MIPRGLPALLVVLAAAPACKKKSASTSAVSKFGELADRMCACKDKACADRVQEEMTKWSSDMAATSRPSDKPSRADVDRMYEYGQRYGQCFAKLTGDAPPPVPGGAAAPAETITNADRLIKVAFDIAGDLAVSKLTLSYVRADGTIDPAYGEAHLDLGKPKPPDPADDPDRPIGAPVPASPPAYDLTARCPSYHWKGGVRSEGETSCLMFGAGIARPRCSVVEVWRRAIEKGAPPKALAVLSLSGPPMQSWTLAVNDNPRDIHFSIDVEDTCDPTLEKPQ